ncbi:hypothetical protein [Streptomyces sp. SPB162]|nr:hypothetical protein [Streptomyces sp. SPB162]MDF9811097.1 hypothetical protein [Streptomyces sp. SPB162]
MDEPPIYAALIRQWHQRGCILPGQNDHEWSTLVASRPGAGGH